MLKKLAISVVGWAAILLSGATPGQDVFTDLRRERADEHRLRHDYRVLHRDMAHGRTAAVQYDQMRIQQDQATLARDQAQLNYDRNGGRPISPNLNNPAVIPPVGGPVSFNPLPASQAIPLSPQPPPQPIPQSMLAPVNPPPRGVAVIPSNPLPSLSQKIQVTNPASTGVTLSFLFAGQTYSLQPGGTRDFSVTAPTVIVFDRGGQTGMTRQLLTPGCAFEFKSDSAGWFLDQIAAESGPIPPNPVQPSPSINVAPVPVLDPTMVPPLPLSPPISRQ